MARIILFKSTEFYNGDDWSEISALHKAAGVLLIFFIIVITVYYRNKLPFHKRRRSVIRNRTLSGFGVLKVL